MTSATTLKLWAVSDSPTAKDPRRRILLVKCALADVHALIRRFGGMCGRPKKTKGDKQFNYSLYLHNVTDANLIELKSRLKQMSGLDGAAASESVRLEASTGSERGGALSAFSPPAALVIPAADSSGSMMEIAPLDLEAPPSDIEISAPGAAVLPSPGTAGLGGSPAAPGGIVLHSPGDKHSPFDGFGAVVPERSVDAAGPAQPAQAARPEDRARPAPGAGVPRDAPVPAGGVDLSRLPVCGVELPLDGTQTLENMTVGGSNRFAHAALMSVMSSPGTMYNPLFVSGPPGSGKTHMLQALAQKFKEQAPDQSVLMTSGSRLAQAVALAVQLNRLGELDAYVQGCRALCIDDLQLMGVSDSNQEALAKLIGAFLGGNKQVVLSSLYSPQHLGAIEEALSLRLSAGHAVELKNPGEEGVKEIAITALERNGIQAEQGDAVLFAEKVKPDFPALEANVKRLRSLRDLKSRSRQPAPSLREMLALVFGPDEEPVSTSPEELKAVTGFREGSVPTALLFPAGEEVHADWIWSRLYQASKQNGWSFPFRKALKRAYEVEPVFGVPFVAAAECYAAGAAAALVLGPAPGCDLAQHEADFRYALAHLLGDLGTALGWVSHRRVKDPKSYLIAYLDMTAQEKGGAS